MTEKKLVKQIKDTIAIGGSRMENYTKATFFCQMLEIYGTHPQAAGFMIPKLLGVMKALGEGSVSTLLGHPQSYEETNLYLQFAFLRNKIDITGSTDGRRNDFGWEQHIDAWIDGLEHHVHSSQEMITLTNALIEVWEDENVK